MTSLSRILRLAGLIACALVVGLTLGHVLQAPRTRGLDGPVWLDVQHTFYGGFAIVGGLSEIVGLAATAAESVLSRRRPRCAVPPAIAALSLLGTLLVYWFVNRPNKRHGRGMDPVDAAHQLAVVSRYLGERPCRIRWSGCRSPDHLACRDDLASGVEVTRGGRQ